jgi:hypothetical protein
MSEITNIETSAVPEQDTVQTTSVQPVPIEKLQVSEANVRKEHIDWEELLPSIEKEGIKEPLEVWHNLETDIYEIMNGQNRFLCAKHLDLKEVSVLVFHDVSNLREAKRWCRRKAVLQRDISDRDKKQIALDLIQEYGNLKKGCEEEGYSYSKLWEWHKQPDELLDGPIKDSRVKRELGSLPEDQLTKAIKAIVGSNLDRYSAIAKVKQIKKQLDSPNDEVKQRYSPDVIDTWAEVGNLKLLKIQRKWCREHGFSIIGPVYQTWKPQERNRELLRYVIYYLKDKHPESNRNILYYLSSLKLVDKITEDQLVSTITSRGRKAGIIPWSWIDDRSRSKISAPSYSSIEECIALALDEYKSDWFEYQDNYVEVWTEKRTLINKLWVICHYFGVTLMPCVGWNSDTMIEDGANRFRERYKQGKKCYLLYLGDFDSSGQKMFDKFGEQFRIRGVPVIRRYIMLSKDQVHELDLEWAQKPVNRKNKNSKWFMKTFGVDWVVEIDAVDKVIIQKELYRALCHYLDTGLIELKKKEDKMQVQEWKAKYGIE